MLMYWHLLERAVERGQGTFDFGRSSPESNTYQFKKQWGAVPAPAEWQYYVRSGDSFGHAAGQPPLSAPDPDLAAAAAGPDPADRPVDRAGDPLRCEVPVRGCRDTGRDLSTYLVTGSLTASL